MDSRLNLTGTLDCAYAFGTASGVPLNGIVFTPFAANPHKDTTTLVSAYTFTDGGLAGNYRTLVSHGASQDLSPGAIQFNELVPGANYAVTVIGMGLRARSDCCQAGAGYNNLLVSGDATGGTGWIHCEGNDASSRNIRGTFTADATGSQTFNLNLFVPGGTDPLTVSANISAVLLSYTSVPEPASAVLLATSALTPLFARRRRATH
jgi:hypothetical protein